MINYNKNEYEFSIANNQTFDFNETKKEKDVFIFNNINENLNYLKSRYNALINSDIVIREFNLFAYNKNHKCFIIYFDGLVDSISINDFVLEPLMLERHRYSQTTNNNLELYVKNCLLPQNNVKQVTNFSDVCSGINMGDSILFIDTLNVAFDVDAKKYSQRGISNPENETIIKGPQEGFIENIRTNTSLLRRIINNENLIIENIAVGKISKTKCGVCYMQNIANGDLVAEVKYRLNNLDIDSITASSQLEQLIEDNSKSSLPQILSTERPDKAANYLLAGRVVIIVNGSPYVLIMPCVFVDFLSSPEDTNLKYQYANLLKLVRAIALFITLLLPGLYVAITNFHQEIIPTELLFAIVASRESVPFPIIVEIIAMEISFELIREASLRVPSPIGTTIGIIGALILGQAAVEASIVSPILIIIIAITGITSFAIPDFYLSFHLRIARFAYIIAGFLVGFLGIGIALFIHLIILCSLKSFGVSYLSPYIPKTAKNGKAYFLPPLWNREKRSDFLNTKRPYSQHRISMKWKYPKED